MPLSAEKTELEITTANQLKDKLSQLISLLISYVPEYHSDEELDRFLDAIETCLIDRKVLPTLAHPEGPAAALTKIVIKAETDFKKDTGLEIKLVDTFKELFDLRTKYSDKLQFSQDILDFSIALRQRIKSAVMKEASVLGKMRESYRGEVYSEWPGLDKRETVNSFNLHIITSESSWTVPGGVQAYLHAGWSPPQAFVDAVMSAPEILINTTHYMGSGGYMTLRISNELLNVIKGNGEIGGDPSHAIGFHFLLIADNGEKIIADSHGGEEELSHGGVTVTKLGSIKYKGVDVTAEFNRKMESLFIAGSKQIRSLRGDKPDSVLVDMVTGIITVNQPKDRIKPMIAPALKREMKEKETQTVFNSLFPLAIITPVSDDEKKDNVLYFSVEKNRVPQLLERINALLPTNMYPGPAILPKEAAYEPETDRYILRVGSWRMRYIAERIPAISDLEDAVGENARLVHLNHKESSLKFTFPNTESMWVAIKELVAANVLNPYQIYLSEDNNPTFYILGPINEAGFPEAIRLAASRAPAAGAGLLTNPDARKVEEEHISAGATIVKHDVSRDQEIIRQTLEAAVVPVQWHEAIKIEFNATTKSYVIKLEPKRCDAITRDLLNKALHSLHLMTNSELITKDKQSSVILKNPEKFVDDIKSRPAIARRLTECMNVIIREAAGESLDIVVRDESTTSRELVHVGRGESFQLATVDPGRRFLTKEMNTLLLKAYEGKDFSRIVELLKRGANAKDLLVKIISTKDTDFLKRLLAESLINPNAIIQERYGKHYSCLAYALDMRSWLRPTPVSAGAGAGFFKPHEDLDDMVLTLLKAGASPLPVTEGDITSVSPLSQLQIMQAQDKHDLALHILSALEAKKAEGYDIAPLLNERLNDSLLFYTNMYTCGDMRAIRKMVDIGATVTPSLIFRIVDYIPDNASKETQEGIYACARDLQGRCAECTPASLIQHATESLCNSLSTCQSAFEQYLALKENPDENDERRRLYLDAVRSRLDPANDAMYTQRLYNCFPDLRRALVREINDKLSEFESNIRDIRGKIPEAVDKADHYGRSMRGWYVPEPDAGPRPGK